jgi:hypothetical protein
MSTSAKRFEMNRPANHWRKATCLEVGCPHYRHGWGLTLGLIKECDHLNTDRCDGLTCHWPEVLWIRSGGTGRHFIEKEQIESLVYQFDFPGEQPCFRESTHRVPKGLDPLLTRRIGSSILTVGDFDEWSYRFNEEMYEADRLRKAG